MIPFLIETPRLLLREVQADDFLPLCAVLCDREQMRHYPAPFDDEAVRGWMAQNQARYATLGFGLWAVVERATGEVIGDCGLTMQMIHGEICPEIGYHIRRDKQRQGFASEAAQAVRDFAFTQTPFREVYAYMKYTNLPSAKTAMAVGMTFVEEYEDPVNIKTRVYRMTKAEWLQQRGEYQ